MSQNPAEANEYIVESIREDGVGLFVHFVKQKDRFGHVLALVQGEECTPLFASIEGTDEEDWPESPPYQEVHMEDRGDSSVALLVGKAGHSHWSAAVEPTSKPGGLQYAVACRMQDYPRCMCSRYGSVMPTPVEPKLERDGPWVWNVNGVEVCVEVIAQEQFPTPELPASSTGFEVNASLDHEPFPKTIQWRYQIWVR
ncbi:hypothetical protein [Bremerella cremea]|uniref:hypothetical protein n=1 Tax=Bremerella cremea TaxID=1031537 RepID=UPI0031EB16E6